jgi:hypothetical protein
MRAAVQTRKNNRHQTKQKIRANLALERFLNSLSEFAHNTHGLVHLQIFFNYSFFDISKTSMRLFLDFAALGREVL